MQIVEQMLFALLRASLHNRQIETSFFKGVSDKDWECCFRLAKSQGVMALAWDGILKLPSSLQPPLELKLQWGIKVEAQEKKYQRYCHTIHELTSFYQEHQIATLQLKGVGLSTLYPIPSHREGGDIDIYTYSADKNKMSDAEANALADKLMQQQGIEVDKHSYKHSNFYYKGIPIENHKSFLNVKDIQEAIAADKILQHELNPHTVALKEGKVQIPSLTFNALFIAFHALQHYGSGIALHHLCDWAVILKHNGWSIPEGSNSKRFLEGVKALTCLCNWYLGTSVSVDGGEDIAKRMMLEILNPPFATVVPVQSKAGVILYKTRRLLHTHHLKSQVFDISLRRRIWSSILVHLRRPETIFRRGDK